MSDISEMKAKDILSYKNTLLSVVIVIIFGFIAKNITSNYNQKMQSLNQKQKKRQEYRALIDQYNKLDSQFNRLAQEYFGSNGVALKSYVETIANNQELQIDSLRPIEKRERFYKINKLVIGLKGHYHGFIRFIRKLEDKNIRIERLNMRQKQQSVDVQLDIKTISLQ
ncbi:MAG: type 4a pilus biogenesis protein PilO [Candidatus Omnitrophica bacterium]|nr:type 4a pilus biogenesis protein PilO [Candidatus Omnitrophota bacterium]MCF7894421.1 type 4a pilus biogenesis protein PilO [Candidatus Omnitrophota bacterium]